MNARPAVNVARGVVVLALALAAIGKLSDPGAFGRAIERYRLTSPLVSGLLAVYLPWLELTVAVAWWRPRWRLASGWVICGLLVAFTVAVALAWGRKLDIRCGCFGEGWDASLPVALVRNLLLLTAAWWVVRTDARDKRPWDGS